MMSRVEITLRDLPPGYYTGAQLFEHQRTMTWKRHAYDEPIHLRSLWYDMLKNCTTKPKHPRVVRYMRGIGNVADVYVYALAKP